MTNVEFMDNIGAIEVLDFTTAVELYANSPEATLQTYEHLRGDPDSRAAEKRSFLGDEHCVNNPALDLPNGEEEALREGSVRLQKELSAVERNVDAEGDEEQAFYEVVAEKAAAVYFLLQAHKVAGLPVDSPSRESEALRLQELNDALYGRPDQEIFDSLVADERLKAMHVIESNDDPQARMVASELLELLPEVPNAVVQQNSLPSREAFRHYQEIFAEVFKGIINDLGIDDEKTYTPEEMVSVFEEALTLVEADDWRVRLLVGETSLATNQEEKVIEVGLARKALKGSRLRQLVAHEVGVHVRRRILGEQTDNPLLWNTGMAGYEPNEEGLGKIAEQLMAGTPEVAGVGHYISTGLSLGLDGTPRDFRDVYEIVWRQKAVTRIMDGKALSDDEIKSAQNDAYNAVVRIKRGMPTDIPGMTYTKDLSYFNGTNNVWNFLGQQLLGVDEFRRLFVGKYDMTRPDQVALVAKSKIKEFPEPPKEPIMQEGASHE